MKKEKNEYFFRIEGLLVPRKCDYKRMDGCIVRYIELAPKLARELEQTFKLRSHAYFISTMETAISLLSDVHARYMVKEGQAILNAYKYNRVSQMRNKVEPFIVEMVALAEEMRLARGDSVDAMYCDEPPEPEAVPEAEPVAEPGKKVILAVDDMPEILASICMSLKKHYTVHGVASGMEALTFLQNNKPDLFLLDIEMPAMDGYELLRLLRAREEHAQTPVIFLTSNSTREHVMKAILAGGNDYVIKTGRQAALKEKIGKYLH